MPSTTALPSASAARPTRLTASAPVAATNASSDAFPGLAAAFPAFRVSRGKRSGRRDAPSVFAMFANPNPPTTPSITLETLQSSHSC